MLLFFSVLCFLLVGVIGQTVRKWYSWVVANCPFMDSSAVFRLG